MVEDTAHAKALDAVFWCFLSEKLGIRFHRFSPSSQFAIQGGAGILSLLLIEVPSKTSARRIQARTDRFVGKPRVLGQIRAPGCVHRSSFRLSYSLSLLTCFFIWSSMVFGQVALDSATSIGQQVSGATPSITLPHTTAGTNRVHQPYQQHRRPSDRRNLRRGSPYKQRGSQRCRQQPQGRNVVPGQSGYRKQ